MCDAIVVVGSDGVHFAKNSDRQPGEAQPVEHHLARRHRAGARLDVTHRTIDQVEATHEIVISRPAWMWGANEHGLAIGNGGALHARTRRGGACFTRYFGDQAKRPIAYADHVWEHDAWSGGCYGAFMPAGVWTSLGPSIREPQGRIHWAGTETATVWSGYIDGAIQSGKRAAQEILATSSSSAARPG